MPIYFFEIRHGDKVTKKNDGIDLPDQDAAWVEATAAFGEMIRDLDGSLKPGSTWRMHVADANGKIIYKLAFETEEIGPARRFY